eukprot:comp10223_c0_seq1/m.12267 comp10223_c0_seq1/g.12267  ORF comp10223_c0_seq1/g.12267 comp10223_c0_seq1/m.12267 type:complete len:329 (-) comp10223_c0_seq1:1232-2218(-)
MLLNGHLAHGQNDGNQPTVAHTQIPLVENRELALQLAKHAHKLGLGNHVPAANNVERRPVREARQRRPLARIDAVHLLNSVAPQCANVALGKKKCKREIWVAQKRDRIAKAIEIRRSRLVEPQHRHHRRRRKLKRAMALHDAHHAAIRLLAANERICMGATRIVPLLKLVQLRDDLGRRPGRAKERHVVSAEKHLEHARQICRRCIGQDAQCIVEIVVLLFRRQEIAFQQLLCRHALLGIVAHQNRNNLGLALIHHVEPFRVHFFLFQLVHRQPALRRRLHRIEHLKQNDAQRIHVHRRTIVLAALLLGRHIQRSAKHAAPVRLGCFQ